MAGKDCRYPAAHLKSRGVGQGTGIDRTTKGFGLPSP